MSADTPSPRQLERLLAETLRYGTWLASVVIAMGLARALIDWHAGAGSIVVQPGMHLVTAGIALLILLPVLRVILMLGAFLRERDYRLSAVAALVLIIIFLGFALGALSRV